MRGLLVTEFHLWCQLWSLTSEPLGEEGCFLKGGWSGGTEGPASKVASLHRAPGQRQDRALLQECRGQAAPGKEPHAPEAAATQSYSGSAVTSPRGVRGSRGLSGEVTRGRLQLLEVGRESWQASLTSCNRILKTRPQKEPWVPEQSADTHHRPGPRGLGARRASALWLELLLRVTECHHAPTWRTERSSMAPPRTQRGGTPS